MPDKGFQAAPLDPTVHCAATADGIFVIEVFSRNEIEFGIYKMVVGCAMVAFDDGPDDAADDGAIVVSSLL